MSKLRLLDRDGTLRIEPKSAETGAVGHTLVTLRSGFCVLYELPEANVPRSQLCKYYMVGGVSN